MRKKHVSIQDCCEGSILAEEIVNSQGIILVAQYTTINSYIKDKLIKMEADRIWIYEPTEEGTVDFTDMDSRDMRKQYAQEVESIKSILKELSSGKKLRYEKILQMTDAIYGWGKDYSQVIRCLGELKSIDEYTYTHSINVSFYALLIAKWLHLSEEEHRIVIQGGLLHDIGKIRIPDKILNKKGKLSQEEFTEMKKHSIYSYELIKNIDQMDAHVKKAVLMHHERLDGSGYPYGTSGEGISLYARIISIADVYDAMISDRIYKSRTSPFEAFQMFLTSGIRGFDVSLIKIFMENLALHYVGTKVALTTGEIGEIVFVPPYDITSPVINLQSRYVDLSRDRDMKILHMV